LNLTESNAKFKGDNDDANLLDKEEIINNTEIKGIKEKVNKGEGATFTTSLPNSMFILY
jgi:hypothetical protein